MKILLIGLFAFFSSATFQWGKDLDEAKKLAQTEHKLILLNFSGSDWCRPCILLHQQIFESPAFVSFAEKNLELVNADFPRLKKNQPPKAQVQKNEEMAARYTPKGVFPLTLLLDDAGNVIKTWEGLPDLTPEAFINEIKAKRP